MPKTTGIIKIIQADIENINGTDFYAHFNIPTTVNRYIPIKLSNNGPDYEDATFIKGKEHELLAYSRVSLESLYQDGGAQECENILITFQDACNILGESPLDWPLIKTMDRRKITMRFSYAQSQLNHITHNPTGWCDQINLIIMESK